VLGVGEGELGTELSLLPKNRSGSGEVDSAGTFQSREYFVVGDSSASKWVQCAEAEFINVQFR
jgi:hypothetical protein